MKAKLYRMVMKSHICPFGIKSKDLLEREGFEVEDIHLETREQTDKFMQDEHVKTTPQTYIDGLRIGGYDDLVKHFGRLSLKQEGTTYQPVIAVFAMTFLMALAVSWVISGVLVPYLVFKLFIAISMCVLAVLKLRDLYSFSNQFVTYDLVARRFVRYAYIYPFAEAFAGLGMIANILNPVVALTSLTIGTIGGVSVIKAVYIEKREIKCACVGGDSKVPLGLISLIENGMMAGMGLWMLSFYF